MQRGVRPLPSLGHNALCLGELADSVHAFDACPFNERKRNPRVIGEGALRPRPPTDCPAQHGGPKGHRVPDFLIALPANWCCCTGEMTLANSVI